MNELLATLQAPLLAATKWALLTTVSAGLVTCGVFFHTKMPGASYSGSLPPLSADELGIRGELKTHVDTLAGAIGERNIFRPGSLDRAAAYITSVFESVGYEVERQAYTARDATVYNISVEKAGSQSPDKILVIGAHYDSVFGTPGANDNATGTAALLVLAARAAVSDRTVRFVAFVNEEPPFFQTPEMGSLVYALNCAEKDENIVGMLSLETIGFYSDKKGSQQYPFPFSRFYPDVGNFIGFVGNSGSREFLFKTGASFRAHTKFPSEGLSAPGWITGVGWSDHWSFWQAGYAGLMITDTAPFRYTHYHGATDTPDKVDYDRMARVVAGLDLVIRDLARDPASD